MAISRRQANLAWTWIPARSNSGIQPHAPRMDSDPQLLSAILAFAQHTALPVPDVETKVSRHLSPSLPTSAFYLFEK